MKKLLIIIAAITALFIAFSIGKCSSSKTPQTASGNESASDVPVVATEYTCSMHPQFRTEDKDAVCPICFMDLIPVPEGADNLPPNAIAMSETAMKRAQIEVAPVIKQQPRRVVRLVGTIETDETKQAMITAWFAGRVEELTVDFTGASVRAGEPLAILYSPQLLIAQTELQEAAMSAGRTSGDSIVAHTARATYEAAKRKLSRWGLSETQIIELENAAAPSDRITITSPIEGVVINRSVETGEYVKEGQTLFEVADLKTVWVLLDAHESELPFLSVDQKVELITDILPGKIIHSTVSFIDPVLNPKTRTAAVRLVVDNSDGELLPGAFVKADVIGKLDSSSTPLLIPRSSVLLTGKRAVVFVQVEGDQPTFEARVVKLGQRGDEMYVVKEGVEEGELVVVQGAFKIDSELQIQAKPSMMSMENEAKKEQVSQDFLMSLNPLYASYFSAQEALAADNFKKFLIAQQDIKTMLSIVDDRSLSGETLTKWNAIAEAFSGTTGKSSDITSARIVFEDMSKAALNLQTTFGHGGSNFYEMYCPMAFDFRGAFWLQRKDSLVNPYFGAEMLKCGETKKIFEPVGDEK